MAGIFVCMERWYLNNVIIDKQYADYIRPLVVIFGRISLLIWLVSAYNVDGAPVNTNKVMGIFIHESICDYHKRFEWVTVMFTSANEGANQLPSVMLPSIFTKVSPPGSITFEEKGTLIIYNYWENNF